MKQVDKVFIIIEFSDFWSFQRLSLQYMTSTNESNRLIALHALRIFCGECGILYNYNQLHNQNQKNQRKASHKQNKDCLSEK